MRREETERDWSVCWQFSGTCSILWRISQIVARQPNLPIDCKFTHVSWQVNTPHWCGWRRVAWLRRGAQPSKQNQRLSTSLRAFGMCVCVRTRAFQEIARAMREGSGRQILNKHTLCNYAFCIVVLLAGNVVLVVVVRVCVFNSHFSHLNYPTRRPLPSGSRLPWGGPIPISSVGAGARGAGGS